LPANGSRGPEALRTITDRSGAMMERDLTRPQVLDRVHRQRRARAEADLGRAVEQTLWHRLAFGAHDLRPARDLLLDDRCARPRPEGHDGSGGERTTRRARAPAQADRLGDGDALRHLDMPAGAPE